MISYHRKEKIATGKYDKQTAWKAGHVTRVVVDLNHNTDADLLRKLAQVTSKQGYIKELIRKDLRLSHVTES